MSPDHGRDRRYRPVRDLTPFELISLVGEGARAADLREAAEALADAFALERLTDGTWRVVGCTASEARAAAWVEDDGLPTPREFLPPCP